MTSDESKRLDNIEILFSEQEYTIQTLNEIVTRHADKIDQLEKQIAFYQQQIIALQEAQNNDTQVDNTIDDRPPHY
ncbi:MAG: SlyX family protein [Gammaproteobacteria bacterium]|nr:SlyX family protein [Gammaproteobacteria bacterium]